MRTHDCDMPRKGAGWSQAPSWRIPSSFLPASQFLFRAKMFRSCEYCHFLQPLQPLDSLFPAWMTWKLHSEMAALQKSKQPKSLNRCMEGHHPGGPTDPHRNLGRKDKTLLHEAPAFSGFVCYCSLDELILTNTTPKSSYISLLIDTETLWDILGLTIPEVLFISETWRSWPLLMAWS